MAKKTLEQLEKEYQAKLLELKKERQEKIKQAKARLVRSETLKRHALRKQEAHLKILIGGFVLAESKKSKNVDVLNRLASSKLNDKDKKLVKDMIEVYSK